MVLISSSDSEMRYSIDIDITADIYSLAYARTNTDPAQADNTYCPGKPRARTNLYTFVQNTIVIVTADETQENTKPKRRAGLAPPAKASTPAPIIAVHEGIDTV